MKIEEFKELLRNTLKYFGHMIRDEIEWVEGSPRTLVTSVMS